MKYREALAIGKADGTIQCTFAIIYDKDGKKLFALQRKNFSSPHKSLADGKDSAQVTASYNTIVVDTGTNLKSEGIIAWLADKRTPDGYVNTGYVNIDFPLVMADKRSDERLVPVRLDYNAIAYIKRTLSSAKKRWMYWLFNKAEWDAYMQEYESGNTNAPAPEPVDKVISKNGGFRSKYIFDNEDRKTVLDSNGKPISDEHIAKDLDGNVYHYERVLDYDPRWLKLSQSLNDTDTYYVKPAAFRWNPIDASHLDGGVYSEDPEMIEKIKQSKARLDRAKALLLTAGATNIL